MHILRKIRIIISMYVQVLFVVLAFALMIVSSYIFVSDVEHNHLKKDAEIALSHMQTNIMFDISESKIILDNVAETIRMMIMRGYNFEMVNEYMANIVGNMLKDRHFLQNSAYIYGVFDVFDAKPGYDPAERLWYKAAIEANGKVAVVEPHSDTSMGAAVINITYARRIFDDKGNPLGIVCMDANLDKISDYVVGTQLAQDGFGLLLNSELDVIAHKNSEFLGAKIKDVTAGISKYTDELVQGNDIFEREMENYKNEESLLFLKQMENGWYVGIVTSKDKYYKSMGKMARILTVLGSALALALSIVLIRIIAAKNKAEARTHKKNLELKTVNHWYQTILDAIPFMVSVQDINMNMKFVNLATESFLKKSRKDILGLPCRLWGINICGTEKCAIVCAKRGKTQTRFSHNGASYQVDVRVLKDLSGKSVGYVEVIQDVTELERMAKAEAESANRAKSAFLAKMSHEIRTPMNVIMGVTEIQIHDELLAPNIKDSFTAIYNSGNLLLGIINNILDLSKIEAGKMEISSAKYEISSLINDAVQLGVIQNKNDHIKFELYVDDNVPMELIGDEIRIKQILNNLLSNAFKYTEKGKVKLSVFAESDEEKNHSTLVFLVSDTGCGMTEEQAIKLFSTEYVRFNQETNRLIEGTGLGMNITQNLVQMMNGKIFVNSELGKGTTFTIHLPQVNAGSGVLGEEHAKELMRLRTISTIKTKKTQFVREYMPYGSVLIVDDIGSNLYVAKRLMLPYGLSIDTASSGSEALKKIKGGKIYDIIFMDHMMPELDGVETTKIMRKQGYTHPIVALTANVLMGQEMILLQNGFDGFISKPIDLLQLDALLNKLIRNKQPPEVIEKARNSVQTKPIQILPTMDMVLLSTFAQDAKKAVTILESTLQNINTVSKDDLRLFTINAHAMKSALANIGETALSKIAFVLETAGKEKDTNTIATQTQSFINSLKEIIEKIEIEEEKKHVDKDENTTHLQKQLKIIEDACKNYDEKTATLTLSNLEQMLWTKKTRNALNKIAEHILHSDFEKAQKEANELYLSNLPSI